MMILLRHSVNLATIHVKIVLNYLNAKPVPQLLIEFLMLQLSFVVVPEVIMILDLTLNSA